MGDLLALGRREARDEVVAVAKNGIYIGSSEKASFTSYFVLRNFQHEYKWRREIPIHQEC